MFCRILCLAPVLLLSGCVSLVAPYDPTFDQSLNKLSEDTAKFLAAASAGGPERRHGSQETVAYYAATYNVLDRLIERARLTRSRFACPANPILKDLADSTQNATALPADYEALDCHEMNLFAVRFNVDLLQRFHGAGAELTVDEAEVAGLNLQKSIMGAIIAFQVEKPS